jgi:2-keto-4-pentenoate hydratase/2-oxohepta-3-ene-1,7-dioic acid hydratase in catechol pathway
VRLVTFAGESGPVGGVLVGDAAVPLTELGAPAESVRGVLAALDASGLAELGARAGAAQSRLPLADVRLLAPVPDPQKIICLGLNYRDHAAETGQEIPAAPMWFAKFANSLVGPGADIVLPVAHAEYVDYEAELAVIIGRGGDVAGATVFNDVSARDLQLQNPLWTSGKAVDTFAPCGPALVTLDEVGDLQSLGLRTRVNGELLQEGSTADMIFAVAETVSWLSRTMRLVPGDIIATGTPAGVGAMQGRFLRSGDIVEVEVDRVGTIVNPVRAA